MNFMVKKMAEQFYCGFCGLWKNIEHRNVKRTGRPSCNHCIELAIKRSTLPDKPKKRLTKTYVELCVNLNKF